MYGTAAHSAAWVGVGSGLRVVGVFGDRMFGTALHDLRPVVTEVVRNDDNPELICADGVPECLDLDPGDGSVPGRSRFPRQCGRTPQHRAASQTDCASSYSTAALIQDQGESPSSVAALRTCSVSSSGGRTGMGSQARARR